MAAVNSVQTTRLPLPSFSPRAVLMYSAAVAGEGVALQLREAGPGDLDTATRLHEERLAIACNEPELLADLLQAAADIGNENDGLTTLFGAASPDFALASDASNSLPLPDHDNDMTPSSSSATLVGVSAGVTTVSVAVAGIDARPHLIKKVRPKPSSPNRQGPQQCQVCNKIFGNASALAKHKLTHSDERKYVCNMCAKAFKRQDHLNGHMLTHRNKKPYECKASGCGKSYCDARSLRRHTENHHQPASTDQSSGNTSTSVVASERELTAQTRGTSPASPAIGLTHSDSSNSGSEKSSGGSKRPSVIMSGSGSGNSSGSELSPPGTPPTPRTPPARTKPHPKPSTSKHKIFPINENMENWITRMFQPPSALKNKIQNGSQKGASSGGSGAASGATGVFRQGDNKPVECNLCHRKFKNIPALNGHMRLHGGYFKKDSDSKKSDKKESTGPPLQTASVSVRALIEEKIISRRGAVASSAAATAITETVTSRTSFVAPTPPPVSSTRVSTTSPASPATAQFLPPRAPPVLAVTPAFVQRDSTLIELLKKGSTKIVKRSASDPGQFSPQPDLSFRPELFGVSFNSDDGYFSPALQDDAFQFPANTEHLEELAQLEDYASVAASIRDRSPVTFPSNRRLAAVLNSPLPESLADFGACHGGSPVPSPGIAYTANSPGLSYTTGDSPGLAYTDASPGGAYSAHTAASPGFGYPTPPGSQDAHSPAHTVPRASSPLSAAFFTATMSSQEEVEEALEEVLPEECGSLDAFALDPSPAPRRIMLNSEDPLLSSSPREFVHQRVRRNQRPGTSSSTAGLPPHQWHTPHDSPNLQGNMDGRYIVFGNPGDVPSSPQRRKRRAPHPGPYRTTLRRTVAHYTPQPMLYPERGGTGLFVELNPGIQGAENDSNCENEGSRTPHINVGEDHQAEIPEWSADRDDLHRVPEQLLWDPGINESLDENEVRMFMELAMCAAMPVGGHTREHALKVLGECGGDVRAATLRLMRRGPERGFSERWTTDELETYLAALRHFDKDFFRISQLIRTKTSKQCVQFYYFWKKLTKNYKTLFLRSWLVESNDQQDMDDKVPTNQGNSGTSSPSPYEGEEFPCKICGKVFNKVKSRSAHMKSHRPLDAEPKRPKYEKPYEKVE